MPSPGLIVRSGPADWLRFARAYLWLYRAKRLMKRARGNQWLFGERHSDHRLESQWEPTAQDWSLIRKRVAAISRASRHPKPWAYCLQRSLALREWLERDGIVTEVRYGVRRNRDGFDAHAWVMYDGKIINDSARHVSTFAPLRSLDEYGAGSSTQIRDAIVTSRTESEGAGLHLEGALK